MVGLVANRKRKLLKAILLYFFYVHHDIMQTLVKRIPKIIREIPTFFSRFAPPLEITHAPQVKSQWCSREPPTVRTTS